MKTQSRIKYDVMKSITLSARFFAHFVKVIDAIRIFTQDKMGFSVSQRALVKQGVDTVQLYTHNKRTRVSALGFTKIEHIIHFDATCLLINRLLWGLRVQFPWFSNDRKQDSFSC